MKLFTGPCTHDVKVTPLNKDKTLFGIRIYVNGELSQEATVEGKENIGDQIYSMLRMEDKCGNMSKMAHRSRFRKWEKVEKAKKIAESWQGGKTIKQ